MPAERSANEHERKRLCELLHPETRQAGAREPYGKFGHTVTPRYTATVAKYTGRGERTIRRDIERAKNIPNIVALTDTSLDKNRRILMRS